MPVFGTAPTLANLLGIPVDVDDLRLNVEVGKKATGASSAVAPGRIVTLTAASGLWALGVAADALTKRVGIVPKKDPLNTDAGSTIQVASKLNTRWYVEGNGAAKPGQLCGPDDGGKCKALAGGQLVYEGHYGEGDAGEPAPTDGAAGQAWRVRIINTGL